MAILTTTIISTILGVVSGGIPEIINYFKAKQEYLHEYKLLELKAEYARQGVELEIARADAEAAIQESKSIYAHDQNIDGGSFLNGMRALIRPVLTIFFFMVWVVVKSIALYHGLYVQNLDVIQLLPIIWDQETAVIFSVIIGFWFGSRAMEKTRKAFDNSDLISHELFDRIRGKNVANTTVPIKRK